MVVVLISTKFELSPAQWVARLTRPHNAQLPELELELLDAYYEGEQPLSYMHPLGTGWEEVMRTVLRVRAGRVPPAWPSC